MTLEEQKQRLLAYGTEMVLSGPLDRNELAPPASLSVIPSRQIDPGAVQQR